MQIYFRSKIKKNRVIINFNFKVCSPQDPASHLHILCKYTIYVYSIKDLLGPDGGTYFKIKIGDDPIFLIFGRKYNCIDTCFFDAHVQLDKN